MLQSTESTKSEDNAAPNIIFLNDRKAFIRMVNKRALVYQTNTQTIVWCFFLNMRIKVDYFKLIRERLWRSFFTRI